MNANGKKDIKYDKSKNSAILFLPQKTKYSSKNIDKIPK